MVKGAHVLGCFIGLAVSSAAFANESVYQKFPTTREELAAQCKELDPISAADRKRFAMADTQGEFYCTGYKGYKVLKKTHLQTSVQFGYLSDYILTEYVESFLSENTVGDTIEWRIDDNGVPRAAIVRFTLIHYVDTDGKTKPAPIVLVISKIGQPNNPVGCAIALVDARANKNANEIARKVADQIEPSFECGQDTPEYHGEQSDFPERLQTVWSDD